MKKQISVVLPLAAAALLGGCAMFHKTPQEVLVGNWTNPLGTVWAIKADGTFQVDLTHHGRVDVWGKYTVSGDTMTINEVHGKTPKACKEAAVYKFKRDGDTLTFTKVSDKCKLREKNILAGWTPWKKK